MVTIHPAQVRSIGNAAYGVSGTVVDAKRDITSAQEEAGAASLTGFDSKAAFDSAFTVWIPTTNSLAATIDNVGGKLISTANTYQRGDDSTADLFQFVPGLPDYANSYGRGPR